MRIITGKNCRKKLLAHQKSTGSSKAYRSEINSSNCHTALNISGYVSTAFCYIFKVA
jgi:hypothetical protein